MSFLDEVSFDVRITVPPDDLPFAVESFSRLARERNWVIDFPEPDVLPYGNEEHDVWT